MIVTVARAVTMAVDWMKLSLRLKVPHKVKFQCTLVRQKSVIEVQHGPVSKQDRAKILKQEVRKKFEMLNQIGHESELFQKHAKLERVIIDVTTILSLFNRKCPHASCDTKSKVINHTLSGGVLKVSWNCPNGHGGYWMSSQVLC